MTRVKDRSDEHVLILGAGYTGTVLAQRLAFRGTPVIGTTRDEQQASVIRTRGARPLMWSSDDLAPLKQFRGRVCAVVSSIPPKMRDDDGYDDPHERLCDFFGNWNLQGLVYISSTSVYGDQGGAVTTEQSPCTPDSPRGAARVAIEKTVLSATTLRPMVIRPAGIYGPGRSQLHRIASGRYRVVGEGDAYTNRIHVRDLTSLIDAALTRGESGATYLASDERPSTPREVADHVVARYGLPAPPVMPVDEAKVRLSRNVVAMYLASKRLDATATFKALGVKPRFPTFVQGLEAIWQREEAEIKALVAAR